MDNKKTHAVAIVRHLKNNGFSAHIVGGAVRDMVMGTEPLDYDIATDASPEDVERLFPAVVPVGRQFGVSLVVIDGVSYEVARYRTDSVYLDGRRPESIKPSGLHDDALRRDFTINAMYYDPDKEIIIDPAGGREDIGKGIIRTVGDPAIRFAEDRLRLLRAVRFAVRFGFAVDSHTMAALKKNAPGITGVSAERIGDELMKMFTGPHPERALDLLDETGLLNVVLPEIAAMKGVTQPPEFHPEGDVYEHTRLMLELFGGGEAALAFGILFHDAGKPATFSVSDRIRFNRHDAEGVAVAMSALERLRFDRATIERVCFLVGNHMRFIHVREMKRSTFRRFIAMDGFAMLLELFRLDCLASHGSLETYEYVRKEMDVTETALPKPLLGGKELLQEGYEEGPVIGKIIDAVVDAQLEGEIVTRSEALRFVRERFPR